MVNGRVVGTRAHPLTYAEGLLLALAYTLSVLTRRRADWGKWALGQYLLLLGLLFSQSRGPWIAANVMVLVVCVLHREAPFYKRLALIYLPIALCFFYTPLRARAFSITNTAYAPNAERLEMWQAGRRMVRDHPFLGVGTGTMPRVSPQYQSETRRLDGPWGHLHNTYVNLAAERGLLTLAAFFAFILALAVEMGRGYRLTIRQSSFPAASGGEPMGPRPVTAGDDVIEDTRIILLTGLLSLAGWLVAGFTETVNHDSNVLMMFYFVMGIALAAARGLRKNLQRV
jgi:O-antigen ligase